MTPRYNKKKISRQTGRLGTKGWLDYIITSSLLQIHFVSLWFSSASWLLPKLVRDSSLIPIAAWRNFRHACVLFCARLVLYVHRLTRKHCPPALCLSLAPNPFKEVVFKFFQAAGSIFYSTVHLSSARVGWSGCEQSLQLWHPDSWGMFPRGAEKKRELWKSSWVFFFLFCWLLS